MPSNRETSDTASHIKHFDEETMAILKTVSLPGLKVKSAAEEVTITGNKGK